MRSFLVLAAALVATTLTAAQAPAIGNTAPVASGWTTVKFPGPQPGCTGVGFQGAVYYDRLDCGFGYVQVTETNLVQPNRSVVKVSFIDSSGVTRNTQTTTARTADNAWQFNITPGPNWTPGTVIVRVTEVDVDGGGGAPNQVGNFGETTFILNQLGASVGVPTSSAAVSFELRTNGLRGEHTMRATADSGNAVGELNELDNSGDLTFTIKGNKVQNGSFQASSSGTVPDGWSGSSTGAGTASYDQNGGTEESKAASTSGNGGNALVYGSPGWTSEPVAVVPGEVLDLVVSVDVAGASSAPSAGLIYLGPLGNVIDTVTLITAPLSTQGFEALESTVTIPAGVAEVSIALKGFAPADLATTGTVTFDDVGLFAH